MIVTPTASAIILIVDDHAEMRRMTKFFLRDLPFEFEDCEDGADAVDCYEKIRPEWVLMDWEMKRMDGLTATRRIIEKHPTTKILMLTQHDDAELKAAALKAGAFAFVLKDDLLNLRKILLCF